MTNGGTQRAPCVGRTDMTYRRPRSGRSASTHGWVSQAKTSRTGIKAKNDGGRSHAREAWGWVLGVAYNRSLLPDCHTSRTSSRTAKVPTAIGFVRPVRLLRLILKNRARRSAAISFMGAGPSWVGGRHFCRRVKRWHAANRRIRHYPPADVGSCSTG